LPILRTRPQITVPAVNPFSTALPQDSPPAKSASLTASPAAELRDRTSLGVATNTIKKHLETIFYKLGVRTRLAALYARDFFPEEDMVADRPR
jgi:hypothetical protein